MKPGDLPDPKIVLPIWPFEDSHNYQGRAQAIAKSQVEVASHEAMGEDYKKTLTENHYKIRVTKME